jgi:hypothetical protein
MEMKANPNLMALKYISDLDKLVLICIANDEIDVWDTPSNLTCGEIAKMTGHTRTEILDSVWGLVENDLITSTVADRMRESKITNRLKKMLK